MNQSISLIFQDLEELTFKTPIIKDFSYDIMENKIHTYHLSLDYTKITDPAYVTAHAFLKDNLTEAGLQEYLLAKHPSVISLKIKNQTGQVQSFPLEWQLLPNPSLQDCQCEPMNALAYSSLEGSLLTIGNHPKQNSYYMEKTFT
ncbi:hypothetical protein HZY91_01885 [Facklamia sp. DSM 111018]|uniref:Uncharacterized protein n=1 Tax=Facklamia lactis TaxID=2749967 RepID=A0ABS0LQS6_9LACT|nr:hypothetical protein [Facklamia lactis]MBG9979681.1 hypothetical protein [Facklamia lactis]MBG9985639.1 hypothetical protein [Facklamia lactis]